LATARTGRRDVGQKSAPSLVALKSALLPIANMRRRHFRIAAVSWAAFFLKKRGPFGLSYQAVLRGLGRRCQQQAISRGKIFVKYSKVIWVVQSWLSKFFPFLVGQINSRSPAVPPERGAFRDRHERRAGCGGRGSVGRVDMRAGRVSREPSRRADERCSNLRQTSVGSTLPTEACGGRCCVRQNRVVLAPVAGVKPAEVCKAQPGDANRQFAGDGDKTNSSPGRARHKP
jgi:hypothetical protein